MPQREPGVDYFPKLSACTVGLVDRRRSSEILIISENCKMNIFAVTCSALQLPPSTKLADTLISESSQLATTHTPM